MASRLFVKLAFTLAFLAGGLTATRTVADRRSRPLEDEIIYVVIVQKFANGDPSNDHTSRRFADNRRKFDGGFWGGDIAGIRQHLDYFVDLGVTALLLYPVVENDQEPRGRYLPTGYRPKDYFHVDRNFGDLQQLKALVKEAHAKDLRVVLDMPLGMPGFEYPELLDLKQQQWLGPPTRYGVQQWNAELPDTGDFLIRVGQFWRRHTDCDGFRIDSAQLHSSRFWSRFVREVKGTDGDNDFLLLAELPLPPDQIDRFVSQAEFDGAYDFSAGIVREVFGLGRQAGLASATHRDSNRKYTAPRKMLAQIDNYEDPTFLGLAKAPRLARLNMAMTYLLTLDRVPLIYPGNELGMIWSDVGAGLANSENDSDCLNLTKNLIALRKAEPALRHGQFEEVHVEDSMLAYLRRYERDVIIVVFNLGEDPKSLQAVLRGQNWREAQPVDLFNQGSINSGERAAPNQVSGYSVGVFRLCDMGN